MGALLAFTIAWRFWPKPKAPQRVKAYLVVAIDTSTHEVRRVTIDNIHPEGWPFCQREAYAVLLTVEADGWSDARNEAELLIEAHPSYRWCQALLSN